MNFFKAIFSLTALSMIISSILSCNNDEPSAQEVTLKKLTAKTWTLQSVKVNGTDQTLLFKNMTLKIDKNTFATTNGSVVWPASGTWQFADSEATTITRNDNVTVNIEELTSTNLRLSLSWSETAFGPGKIKSISGIHIFDFN